MALHYGLADAALCFDVVSDDNRDVALAFYGQPNVDFFYIQNDYIHDVCRAKSNDFCHNRRIYEDSTLPNKEIQQVCIGLYANNSMRHKLYEASLRTMLLDLCNRHNKFHQQLRHSHFHCMDDNHNHMNVW